MHIMHSAERFEHEWLDGETEDASENQLDSSYISSKVPFKLSNRNDRISFYL